MEAVSGDEERDRDALSLLQVKPRDARSRYVPLSLCFRIETYSLLDAGSALDDEAS